MASPLPERIDARAKRLIVRIVERDFVRSGVARSALAQLTNIPRETLRRKMASGDLTVGELYLIAQHINADADLWFELLASRLKAEEQ